MIRAPATPIFLMWCGGTLPLRLSLSHCPELESPVYCRVCDLRLDECPFEGLDYMTLRIQK